jgi:hypothetical protein
MSSDTVQLEGYVGPVTLADGPRDVTLRIGNQGELITSKLNADFYEQTLRGNAFVYAQAATGVALAAPSVNSVPMIWNPSGSGKNLVIHKVVVGWKDTTWAVGHIDYAILTNAGSQTGTAAPVVSLTQVSGVNLLIGTGNVSVMRFAPATVTLAAAPTYLCPMGVSSAAGAAATAMPNFTMVDRVDGHIICPPGTAFFVVANAAVAGVCAVAIYGLELPVPPTA